VIDEFVFAYLKGKYVITSLKLSHCIRYVFDCLTSDQLQSLPSSYTFPLDVVSLMCVNTIIL